MTNEAQLPMMKNMLNSALKCGFPMHLFHCFILNSNKEAAKNRSEQFKSLTTKKLEIIRLNMKMDTTMWVDNDIVFFENYKLHELEQLNHLQKRQQLHP